MRAIWNGAIGFGLVQIPMKLYSALKKHGPLLHEIHATDHARIRHVRVCSRDGMEVPPEEYARGFEYQEGQFIPVDEDELAYMGGLDPHLITIETFVNMQDVDPHYFAKPYYLAPHADARKAYAVLHEALRLTGKMGIGRFLFRSRPYLAGIRAYGDAILLHQLYFHEQVRPYRGDLLPALSVEERNQAIPLALQIVERLCDRFTPAQFKDTYAKQVQHVLAQKVTGAKRARPERHAPFFVHDDTILEELQKSARLGKRERARS